MSTIERTTTTNPDRPLRRVLSQRDFRLLIGGASTSLMGDQFALIATPWLVLALTDDPFALGLALALAGVPRAAVMLLGGAVTDRVSPRRVMLVADIVRFALVGAMATVVLAGAVQMWMLYAFAVGFGLVAGFAVPAENSIVPLLVRRDDLQTGNAVMMGITQLTGFVGPTLAGAVIGLATSTTTGAGIAFAVDAATFAVSAAACALMGPQRSPDGADAESLVASIREGLHQLADDVALRFVFWMLAIANLLVVGPLLVGIPLLAHDRMAGGAAAFGMLMAAFSIGNLAGYVVAGATRRPTGSTMRVVIVAVFASYGAVLVALSAIELVAVAAALLAGLGLGNGYLSITLFTWVQTRTPPELLGRTVSLVTFAGIGLVSVSQAASGALASRDLDLLLVLAGGLLLAATVVAARHPGLRAVAAGLGDERLPDDQNQIQIQNQNQEHRHEHAIG